MGANESSLYTYESSNFATFNHDDTLIVALSPGRIKLLSPDTLKIVKQFNVNHYAAFSSNHNGTVWASASDWGTIRLWNPNTEETISELDEHTKYVTTLKFNHNGTLLASGSDDLTIKLWNISTYKSVATLTGHTKTINAVTFNHDGTLLASGSEDCTVKLWNTQTHTNVATLRGHTDNVSCIAFDSSGRLLASGSDDSTVKLWNTQTHEIVTTLRGHTDEVTCIAFNNDGTFLASGSKDNTVILWNPNQHLFVKDFASFKVKSVFFNSHGTMLVMAGSSGMSVVTDFKPIIKELVVSQSLLSCYDHEVSFGNKASIWFSRAHNWVLDTYQKTKFTEYEKINMRRYSHLWYIFVIYVGNDSIPDALIRDYIEDGTWAGVNDQNFPETKIREENDPNLLFKKLKEYILYEIPNVITSLYESAKRICPIDTDLIVYRGISVSRRYKVCMSPKLIDSWTYCYGVATGFAHDAANQREWDPADQRDWDPTFDKVVLVRKITKEDLCLPITMEEGTSVAEKEYEIMIFEQYPQRIIYRRFHEHKLYLEVVSDKTCGLRLPTTYNLVDIPACGKCDPKITKEVQEFRNFIFDFNYPQKLEELATWILSQDGCDSEDVVEQIDKLASIQNKNAGKRLGDADDFTDIMCLFFREKLPHLLKFIDSPEMWIKYAIQEIRTRIYSFNINLDVLPKFEEDAFTSVRHKYAKRKRSETVNASNKKPKEQQLVGFFQQLDLEDI